ncbi:MAG: hypothetical protein WKI04_06080 [Ferruginibacter sp.]
MKIIGHAIFTVIHCGGDVIPDLSSGDRSREELAGVCTIPSAMLQDDIPLCLRMVKAAVVKIWGLIL